jgi:hypothetical protein
MSVLLGAAAGLDARVREAGPGIVGTVVGAFLADFAIRCLLQEDRHVAPRLYLHLGLSTSNKVTAGGVTINRASAKAHSSDGSAAVEYSRVLRAVVAAHTGSGLGVTTSSRPAEV